MKKIILLSILSILCCSCREKLLHNLEEQEANRLIATLFSANIDAQKEQQSDGRWAITVPNEKTHQTIKFLNEGRFFKEEKNSFLKKSSILSSRDEQRFQFERALSSEIEFTLTNIENVLQSRVHLNLPIRDPFLGKKINADDNGSASVLLVVNSTFKGELSEIRNLVAGASGISADAVTVFFNKIEQQKSQYYKDNAQVLNFQRNENLSSFFKDSTTQICLSIFILLAGLFFFLKKRKEKNKVTLKGLAETLKQQTNQIGVSND